MGGSGSSCFLSFKVLLGGIATLSFVLLLLVGALESGATSETTTSRLASAQATQINDLKDEHEKEVIGREKLVYNSELDLSYMMSKRRVPNGPDPIHNRYVRTPYIYNKNCFSQGKLMDNLRFAFISVFFHLFFTFQNLLVYYIFINYQ